MKGPEQNSEKSFSPKDKYLERLRWFRNRFIDELPPEKLSRNDSNYHRYKCRGNYFQGVAATLERIIADGMILSPELVSKIEQFHLLAFEEKDFSEFVTQEEIDKVNKLLDEIIEHLS